MDLKPETVTAFRAGADAKENHHRDRMALECARLEKLLDEQPFNTPETVMMDAARDALLWAMGLPVEVPHQQYAPKGVKP